MLKPLKAVWTKSWTKAWGYAQVLGSAVLFSMDQLNNWISDPHVQSYIAVLKLPSWVPLLIATLGFITWLAHGRENA